jgi:elongator complex protein 3
MGAQSLDDAVLALNQRGHTAAETLRATALLRAAGFKIVLHWMPNLLGATPQSDRIDFSRLWNDGYAPDEIKIYPCQLLAGTALHSAWQRGEYRPYPTAELVALIADIKPVIPRYCRVNRIIRDIPSTHVIEGNRRTSLRMDVLAELRQRGQSCQCVRCREVREEQIDPKTLTLVDLEYPAAHAREHFLQFVTPADRIAGYLRLSLPDLAGSAPDLRAVLPELAGSAPDLRAVLPELAGSAPDLRAVLPELAGSALVREVHVYGQSLPVGGESSGAAQHIGLGTRLLERAAEIARSAGFQRLAVIASVGTRLYYQSRGFERGEYYMVKQISSWE